MAAWHTRAGWGITTSCLIDPMGENRLRGESQRALARIPIRDNGEPLVDFIEVCPRIRFAPEHPVFTYERARLARRSVAERLCQAQALLPEGYVLEVVEGWRSLANQQMMYDATYREYREAHP